MSDDLDRKIEVVRQLTQMFKFERLVYLSITIVSLMMLLGSAIALIVKGQAGIPELGLLFGSSGLITYTASRLLFMWNEALRRIFPLGDKGQT
jgi:hypothetical protein